MGHSPANSDFRLITAKSTGPNRSLLTGHLCTNPDYNFCKKSRPVQKASIERPRRTIKSMQSTALKNCFLIHGTMYLFDAPSQIPAWLPFLQAAESDFREFDSDVSIVLPRLGGNEHSCYKTPAPHGYQWE